MQLDKSGEPASNPSITGDFVADVIDVTLLQHDTYCLSVRNALMQPNGSKSLKDPPVLARFDTVLSKSDRDQVKRFVAEREAQAPKSLSELKDKLTGIRQRRDSGAGEEQDCSSKMYPPSPEFAIAAATHMLAEERDTVQRDLEEKFGSNPNQLTYAILLLKLGGTDRNASLLSTALLPALWRNFEQTIAGLTRTGLMRERSALGELPTVPLDVTSKFGANSRTLDLRRWAIDRKTDNLVKLGPAAWREALTSWIGVDLAIITPNWALIVDAHARSKLLSGERFSNQSADTLPPGDIEQVLSPTNPSYVLSVIDEISTICSVLAFKWRLKFSDYPEEALVSQLLDHVVEMEERSRWAHALSALDAVLTHKFEDPDNMNLLLINQLYCSQESGHDTPHMTAVVKSLEASHLYAKIGKAAVLHEYEALYRLISDAIGSTRRSVQLCQHLQSLPLVGRAVQESPEIRRLLNPSTTSRPRGHASRKKGRR